MYAAMFIYKLTLNFYFQLTFVFLNMCTFPISGSKELEEYSGAPTTKSSKLQNTCILLLSICCITKVHTFI